MMIIALQTEAIKMVEEARTKAAFCTSLRSEWPLADELTMRANRLEKAVKYGDIFAVVSEFEELKKHFF